METSNLGEGIPTFDAPTLQNFDTSNVQEMQRIGGARNRQFVRFYKKLVPEVYTVKARINEKTGASTPLEVATRQREREMVEIVTPGDKNRIEEFADDGHRRAHWDQYQAFREGRTAPIGTPLEQVPFIPPGIATELAIRRCLTLEQLADASDLLCGQIPDGYLYRDQARAYCKTVVDAKADERVMALKSQLDASHLELSKMQQQIDALKGLIFDANGNQVASARPEEERPRSKRKPAKTEEAITE